MVYKHVAIYSGARVTICSETHLHACTCDNPIRYPYGYPQLQSWLRSYSMSEFHVTRRGVMGWGEGDGGGAMTRIIVDNCASATNRYHQHGVHFIPFHI